MRQCRLFRRIVQNGELVLRQPAPPFTLADIATPGVGLATRRMSVPVQLAVIEDVAEREEQERRPGPVHVVAPPRLVRWPRLAALAALALLGPACGSSASNPGMADASSNEAADRPSSPRDLGLQDSADATANETATDGGDGELGGVDVTRTDGDASDGNGGARDAVEADASRDGLPVQRDTGIKSGCSSAQPSGCYRGMYLSLWSTGVGAITFAGPTEQHRYILGDAAKEGAVLAFITARRMQSLSLYNLEPILSDKTRLAALVSFLARARDLGVLEVNAISDATKGAWDRIATIQTQNKLFDGLVTESEFWNPGTSFAEFRDALIYIRSLKIEGRTGGAAVLGVYIGRPDQAQIDSMLPLIDRLYVHVYVKTAEQAYSYGSERFAFIAGGNQRLGTKVDVRPIFSAEGLVWAAGDEHFMGDWLGMHSLDEAEQRFRSDWEGAPATTALTLTGFQHYDYFFLERYLK